MSTLAFLNATVPVAKPKPKQIKKQCMIIGIMGPPGTGKTTLAEAIVASQVDGDWKRVNKDKDGRNYIDVARAHLQSVKNGGGGVVIDMCMTTPVQRTNITRLSKDTDTRLVLVQPSDPPVDLFARGLAGVLKRGHNHESLGPLTPMERARVVAIFTSQIEEVENAIRVPICKQRSETSQDGADARVRAMLTRINGDFNYKLTSEDEAVLKEMLREVDVEKTLGNSRAVKEVVKDVINNIY